ncbi:Na+/H+ antiporter [Burkholderia anthina]|uniref:Na+/H+ antiporter n=1 Tax=Burkholderia anthina TaxID=179879 RepID=UPI001CF293CE|nr:Na+/H+ antiporter [Burkholderia anthina]MCA8094291.1 Na+/H+ antiporter [Burkholderia anthina]
MDAISTTLVLLACVIAGSIVKRAARLPLPLALVQIALGALVAELTGFRASLAPDTFLLLFVAPLLFLDGWCISKTGLYRDRWTVAAFALGLVLFTVAGAGWFIHWLIPAMPVAIAFALAATLSPTDSIAVSDIAQRTPLPARLMHVLEGEALLNDASGLVCLRFAIAAALTGAFSPAAALRAFLWLAIAGVGAGIAVAWLANRVKDWTAAHFGEETGVQILISLLLPFAAFMIADRLGASGVLAAAAAGIAMSAEELAGRALPGTRIRRAAVWDALQFAGNGVIFVLLGGQLSFVIAGAGRALRQTGQPHAGELLVYVAAIGGVLLALRSAWAWAALRVIRSRGARHDEAGGLPDWRLVAVTSLAGVRGAVSLSGIMTLPLALADGSPLPARDLAIFLAAGVIVVSLLAANAGLPRLLGGIAPPHETRDARQERMARRNAARAAIAAVEFALRDAARDGQDADLVAQAGARLIAHYREQAAAQRGATGHAQAAARLADVERRLRTLALDAERDALYRLTRSGRLPDELARALVREIDLQASRPAPRRARG